ncbi:MAG TPA: choice-of-anchor tandem repeat GloVer-containing protein [Ideonella sp.]|uniref:choice-of-anchor tandem repeat GloVer-containing protein n=1 Tax=Ideonella sp. TaxID=1929293 RepID=UPI002E2FB8C5|nr:choice-of-anchor tandem repeat GloVer-containing protein [Ideonella sp.]HEX5685237.1 choice-of-anchor tandem repeat GloVer-containing protein [Ideonella sp.]
MSQIFNARTFARSVRVSAVLAVVAIGSLPAFDAQAANKPARLLHAFTSSTDGYGAAPALQHGANDRFYGVNSLEGPLGGGTVYAFDRYGSFTVLHAFNSLTEGSEPMRRVAISENGLMYGVLKSGANGCGAIFRLSTTGDSFAIMYKFKGTTDGCGSTSGLVQGADGSYYGTATSGGSAGWGTVFRWDPLKGFKTLHHFTRANGDGGYPLNGVTLSADGKSVYGVTNRGGSEDGGVLFKVQTDGTGYQVLHSMEESFGSWASSELILAKDGNFYGAAERGGSGNHGTLYRMTPSGETSLVYAFQSFGVAGYSPAGPLTEGRDGLLYGTTQYDGAYKNGTLFALGRDGQMTIMHAFSDGDAIGSNARGGLAKAHGYLYGATGSRPGSLFRIRKLLPETQQ